MYEFSLGKQTKIIPSQKESQLLLINFCVKLHRIQNHLQQKQTETVLKQTYGKRKFQKLIESTSSLRYISIRKDREAFLIREKLHESRGRSLAKEENTPIVQAQIASYSELLVAMNYFQSRGGIIDAQGKHAANLKQIQNELSTSKQNQQELQSSINLQSDKCQAQDKHLEEARKLQKNAEEEAQSLQNQIQNFQEKYENEKKGYGQQLSLTQQESQKQKQELEKGIQQYQLTAQKQLTEQKGNADSKITQINQENSQLASQLAEINKQIQGLQEELKGYESKEKQLRDQIQQNQS